MLIPFMRNYATEILCVILVQLMGHLQQNMVLSNKCRQFQYIHGNNLLQK